MAKGESGGDGPVFPGYLIDAFERLLAHLESYDATGDARQLLRALNVACEQLNRFAEDSGFLDLAADLDHQAPSPQPL